MENGRPYSLSLRGAKRRGNLVDPGNSARDCRVASLLAMTGRAIPVTVKKL
jgi:hypothetical protein